MSPSPTVPGLAAPWREPTRALPLRWGRYEDRYLWGLILVIAGGAALQGANTYTNFYLLQATTAFVVGWSILPSRGWRRILVILPATTQIWLLLTGPFAVWTFVLGYLSWLLVRHRPLRSYLTVVFPLANGFVLPNFFTDYSMMLPALVVSLGVCVVSAWMARLLAAKAAPHPADIQRDGIA